MHQSFLIVLGERRAIGWVLRGQQMAFPAMTRPEVRSLAPGDHLYLYATRGAWGNPTRDRGRVIAYATAESPARALDVPVEIAGRSFHSACSLKIGGVVRYPSGVELQPLVHRMSAFPKAEAWSVYLRRPLVRLPPADTSLLDERLDPFLQDPTEVLDSYPW